MAINWSRTWSQLNDEEALKSRKATGGIDWDTTRKQIEKEQVEAHQAEVKAAAQASKQQEKLKQRKLQTAPFAARAAETLAGLQEGSEIPKLHPTGGPLSVSQDTLRDLGMVNENGFVLGGVDPGKLGLDAADMAKLGLPASSVAASGGATFPAKAGKAGVFGGRDYAGYLAGEFGAGMLSNPTGILSGAQTAVGDLFTGGQVSEGMKLLANYFAQKPQMLDRWMANETGVEQMIQAETGATGAQMAAYRAANIDDWLRGQLQQATGANLPQGYKDAAGNIAYTLGQQVPGFVYSMGAPAADGGGILSSVASAIKNKSGVGRALASSTKGALKGNVNTWLIGAGAAGNQLTELAKQRGYDPVNYINAMGNGFVEYISEGLLGFSDGGSIKAIWRETGSKTGNTLKSVARWLMSSVEEGLEEVINVPMSGIVDKMTVEPDKKLVGEGGIFDLKEMLRAGIMGATVGMIMGGVGAVCSIHSAVLEGASIFDAATATNHLIDTIPKDMRPAHIDPKTATAETLEQKQAEVLEKLKEAEEASSTTGFAGGPPSPQAGKALAEDRQNTANQQAVDISQSENQQGFEQVQNMPVQNNAQAVDVNQEVLNNEQGQVLSGNGPQRGFAAADAGGAGAVERAGTAASARRTQSAIAAERTARAQSAYLTPVSARELGLESGTDVRRNILLDDDGLLDDELRQIKQHWDEMNRTRREKYGNTVDTRINFVLGKIQVEDMNGGMTLVDGVVNDNGEVFVQVNGTQRRATELADHEEYHLLEAETPGLTRAIWNAVSEDGLNDAMIERYRRFYTETLGYSDEMVREEILADAYAGLERIRGTNMQSVRDLVRKLTSEAKEAIDQGWYDPYAEEAYESVDREGRETRGPPEMRYSAEGEVRVNAQQEVRFSLEKDDEFMSAAEKQNNGMVDEKVMEKAREDRKAIADIFNDPELQDSLGLPPDIIGNTYIPNGIYSGTEENTTECIRSIVADALMDAVAEKLERPLTVEDTVAISQQVMNFTDKPECLYCYVAMDRKAHREFLGSYLKQRDEILEEYRTGDWDANTYTKAQIDRMSEEEKARSLYVKFLDGRKPTKPMANRFAMWLKNDGKEVITAKDLASTANMERAADRNPKLKAQINDALKYAQSASWAKKRLSYAAYNNHILKWKADRIRNLNSNYGLRMYSFSDFSPAFILENMQMFTDSAVRGLKVLAYTKELDFVRIFAKTGANINISVFGYDDGAGGVAMDAMQGADWAEAQELRRKYKNVGCTFVATNDAQVEWALGQDWIDVVIPFHLVRTGAEVAKYFNWTNYTQMSSDVKTKAWKPGNAKHILPPEHQNNKKKYLSACKANNLTPRFEKWVENPNYMKLVNETRQSEAETEPVQPVFDIQAAKASIEEMRKRGGYYTPIGGSVEEMYGIAEEIAANIRDGKTGVRFSVADETDSEGNELSVEQAEFFRDSKVRVDEYGDYGEQDGSLVPVYHATWNDEFTVFDAGRLGEYTDKNAMDDWFAATAHVGFWFNTQDLSELKKVGKRSEKVYLNIKRPYRAGTLDGLAEDIATCTEDYIEEDTPAERGSVFAKWLEWNGYDGVMLNDEELGGVSFVALYPEQIKRVSNTRPTEAADIRYSVASESDAEQEATERPRRDLTPGQELTRKEHTVIKRAINQSKMQLRDIVPAGTKEAREVQQMQILDLAQKLWETGEITQENIDDAFEEIWLKSAMVDRELADQYSEVRHALRTGVTVSEALRKEITDYEKFRRANFGAFTIRGGEQSDVDVAYQELSTSYPNLFPADITEPADKLQQMADVAQRLKPVVRTMSEMYGDNVDAKAAMKADFVDLVRNMELEILHPVQDITKKQKDQKEAERVASFRQIYKEVMDEVFKVKQRETFEPNPEYWHEVADDAWERMNERAEAIQTEWLRSLTKEGFKGTESLDELGVRIAGSVADYHLVGQVLENHRAAKAIQRDIKKAETKLNATAKEKNYAAGIASGAFTEADISGDARPHVVLELADYYMMERAVGLDLISERRKNMYADVDYQVEKLMSDKATYRVSPSPVLFYRTPQRNMIKIYGREHGQKVYDYLFAPVAENEAERIRWVNKMYDEVRLVEGSDGKKKQLNREERALVQLLMEGRAVAEVVAAMEEREIVYDAAANLRNGQDIEDIVRQFNLNQEMRNAVVDYATWLDTNDILETTKGIDQKKIDNAVVLYAKQYDKFYKAINDFLAAHGYEPIGFINGYAPHFQPERTKNMLEKTLTAMGLSSEVAKLPTAIAGLTHVYRPNKRWDPHFLKRRGKQTEYDVAAGYERYLDYLSDILFHMDDTVRIRRAANYFRREGAPQEITEQISHAEGMRMAPEEDKADFLRQMGSLSRDSNPSEKDVDKALDGLIDNMYKDWDDKGKYNSLVNWLEDYANQLTGKQSMVDRGMEILAGRTSLNFANKLNRAFQRANVAGNLSTALNQTAQLPMIVADIGHINTVRALFDYARGIARRDGFREKSDFLTARKGINNLVVDPADRIINIMFTPAQVADDMMSYAAARGAYIKAVRQGMSDAEAMKYADRKAEQIMGSRAKGSAPQAFRSKNPLVRMVNMFQIEALNAFEYVEQDVIIQGIKDIKQIDDSKGRAKATAALIGLLGKMLVAAFLWNRTTEELYGGSPAQFDLLGYAANFLASGNGLTANEQLLDWIDMAWERAFGEPLFDIDPDYNEEFDWKNATGDLGYAISSDIPFVRNVAGLMGLGDQSLPMPDLSTVSDAFGSLRQNGFSAETLDAALAAAGQFLPGGRQINKTYQGARTMIKGGRYYGYGDNERLQYPVDDTTANWIKALLFGPSGLSENTAFYAAGGDDDLSAANTRKYQEMMQVGMSSEMALEVYEEYRRINRLESMTASEKATEFANTLDEMGIPEEQKTLAREAFMFWDRVPGEATKYDTFVEGGLEPDMAYELTETLGELEPEDGKTSVSNLQKYQAVLEMTDVESTRYAALAGLMPDKELARLRAAYDYVQSGTYVEFLTAFDEAYPGESKSQERVETVLKQMRLDNEERAALWQMCGPKWKTDNNPFSKTVGREVARLIEEYYAEIDGE